MVFIGVIVVLSNVFIPAIASSNSGGESETIGNMQINAVDPLFFLVVFFYGVNAQAMGNGAMAGIMATGRLSTGMKHAGMMMIICLVLFNIAAFSPSLIGVHQSVGLSPDIGFIPIAMDERGGYIRVVTARTTHTVPLDVSFNNLPWIVVHDWNIGDVVSQ